MKVNNNFVPGSTGRLEYKEKLCCVGVKENEENLEKDGFDPLHQSPWQYFG